jgi:hypothetical protein
MTIDTIITAWIKGIILYTCIAFRIKKRKCFIKTNYKNRAIIRRKGNGNIEEEHLQLLRYGRSNQEIHIETSLIVC